MDNFENNLIKALNGDQYSMWYVAYAYLTGNEVEQNIEEGKKWYDKLVDLNNEDAAIDYSKFLFYGDVLEKDIPQAINVIKKFVDKEMCHSMEWMACILESEEFNKYEEAFEIRQKAASQGYENACINLGMMYKNGRGINQDVDKALQYLIPYADNNISFAAYNVGEIYQDKGDMNSAIKYYSIAANEDARAQYLLGIYNLMGDIIPQNIEKGIEWFEKSAEQGFPEAYAALGNCYETNQYGMGNGEKALYWFEKAISNGIYDVYHNLGNMYMNGEVVTKNMDMAIQYYTKSAQNGYVESQRWLAQIYRYGDGVDENPQMAFYWEKIAVENGYKKSVTNLANYYLDGYGTNVDIEKGIELMTSAAMDGDISAQCNLGNFYRLGKFVAQDYSAALYWYELAIKQNDDIAMNNAASIYKTVYKDMKKAFSYFLSSAELGNTMAQFNVALMYKYGEGTEKNLNECQRWLLKAANQGDDDAYVELGVLFEDGLLGYPDYFKASEWYKKAIEMNNARAMCYLSILILNRRLPNLYDVTYAKDLLVKSNQLGYMEAVKVYNHFF